LTPAGVRGWGDPTGAKAPRRLPGTPAESKCLERKSTAKVSTAFVKVYPNFLKNLKSYPIRVAFFICLAVINDRERGKIKDVANSL
jgi:hypothetical protein